MTRKQIIKKMIDLSNEELVEIDAEIASIYDKLFDLISARLIAVSACINDEIKNEKDYKSPRDIAKILIEEQLADPIEGAILIMCMNDITDYHFAHIDAETEVN